MPPHNIFHEAAFYVKMAGMTEPAVLYELDNEPAAVDPTIAAAAIACRMSYTAVNRAVVDYMNGERQPVGTPDYLAVLAWRAVTEYVRIVGDDSYSAMGEAAPPPIAG